MFGNKKKKIINLHQPKIFSAPKERKQEKKAPKLLFFLLLGMVAILAFFYLFYLSPVFRIENIEVIGSPNNEISESLDRLKGHNLFLFSASALEKKIIDSNHDFLKVKVYRGVPDTVRIVFEDREPKIIWQSQGQNYLVDKNAIAFKQADKELSLPKVIDNKNLPLQLPAEVGTANFINFLVEANSSLNKNGFPVKQFEVEETTFQITAQAENGLKIKLNTLRPLSDQVDALKEVYEKHKNDMKQYIDVRVEGWVYYK